VCTGAADRSINSGRCLRDRRMKLVLSLVLCLVLYVDDDDDTSTYFYSVLEETKD
jgi:hypothetical protein